MTAPRSLRRTEWKNRARNCCMIRPPGNSRRNSAQKQNSGWRISTMKFMTTWSFPTGALPEAAQRFLAGQAAPEEGVKLLGRWHNIDLSGGFLLSESDNPIALYKGSAKWGDLL